MGHAAEGLLLEELLLDFHVVEMVEGVEGAVADRLGGVLAGSDVVKLGLASIRFPPSTVILVQHREALRLVELLLAQRVGVFSERASQGCQLVPILIYRCLRMASVCFLQLILKVDV